DQRIDRRGERDVLEVGVGARLELIGDDAAARDRLERDGPDELRRRVRHHGDHVVPALLEPAHDLDRLVRPNPAGHAERDQCHCVTRLANYPITRLSNYSITRLLDYSIVPVFVLPGSIFSTYFVMTSRWATVVFLCSPTSTRGTDPARS